MKVYVTDEKEVILEPSVKWAANPNITIVVRAFGLKATAQVQPPPQKTWWLLLLYS